MPKEHTGRSPEDYRIIFQQDAPEPMIRAHVPELNEVTLVDHSIGQFDGLVVDVYAAAANHAGGAYFNSTTMERILSAPDSYRSSVDTRLIDRLEQLVAAGTDPLRIYCAAAHEVGMDFMVRVRMNDLHDVVGKATKLAEPNRRPLDTVGEPYYYEPAWKRDNPQYLLGDPYDDTEPKTFQFWQRSAMNFALGKTRQYLRDFTTEIATTFDMDAICLDFIRFAIVFFRAEAYAQRHVMTGLVRQIRAICTDAGNRRGRPILLAARVPDTIELGLRAGIDTEAWLRAGLLDLVEIGGGYSPFGTPWDDIAAIAAEAGVPATACINHGMLGKDPSQFRAAAHRAYAKGVSGLTLWNTWYCFDYYHPEGRNPLRLEQFLNHLAAPSELAQQPLTYAADPEMDPEGAIGSVHYNHAWPGQVPLVIGHAIDGIGQIITFDVPEDHAARSADAAAQLYLHLKNFWVFDDTLELYWNGVSITSDARFTLIPHQGAEAYDVTCDLSCSDIRAGANQLELRLVERDARLDPFISLLRAELRIPAGQ